MPFPFVPCIPRGARPPFFATAPALERTYPPCRLTDPQTESAACALASRRTTAAPAAPFFRSRTSVSPFLQATPPLLVPLCVALRGTSLFSHARRTLLKCILHPHPPTPSTHCVRDPSAPLLPALLLPHVCPLPQFDARSEPAVHSLTPSLPGRRAASWLRPSLSCPTVCPQPHLHADPITDVTTC